MCIISCMYNFITLPSLLATREWPTFRQVFFLIFTVAQVVAYSYFCHPSAQNPNPKSATLVYKISRGRFGCFSENPGYPRYPIWIIIILIILITQSKSRTTSSASFSASLSSPFAPEVLSSSRNFGEFAALLRGELVEQRRSTSFRNGFDVQRNYGMLLHVMDMYGHSWFTMIANESTILNQCKEEKSGIFQCPNSCPSTAFFSNFSTCHGSLWVRSWCSFCWGFRNWGLPESKIKTSSGQWPFQDPKLEVPTIYKAYIRPM